MDGSLIEIRRRNAMKAERNVDGTFKARSLRERFEAKFVKDPESGCWLWTHSRHDFGYGMIWVQERGRTIQAMRVAWELYRGSIPGGLCVCHKCDVPACVNPDHLFLGTHQDNLADMTAKGRRICRANAQLTLEQAAEIRRIYVKRHPVHGGRALGKQFGVSETVISNIVLGHTYGTKEGGG